MQIINKQSIIRIEKSFIWEKLRTVAQKCGLHQGRKCSGEAWFSAHSYILLEQRTNIKHNRETFLESFKRHRLLWRADLRYDWHCVPTMLLCHAAPRLPVHQKAPRLRPVYLHCLEIQVENHCCLEPPSQPSSCTATRRPQGWLPYRPSRHGRRLRSPHTSGYRTSSPPQHHQEVASPEPCHHFVL